MNASIAHCRYLLSVAEPILAGLNDSHCALEPQPGAKTAGWLVGHLAVTGDFARRLCGRTPLCPVAWRNVFKPGSEPSADPNAYPAMTSLSDTFRRVYSDLCEAVREADPARLEAANPIETARSAFPTAGEFVEYLLSSHLAYHLGQLVSWQAIAGFGPR